MADILPLPPLPDGARFVAAEMAKGKTPEEIVRLFNLDELTVRDWIEHPEFRKALKACLPRRDDVEREIDLLIYPALDLLSSVLRGTASTDVEKGQPSIGMRLRVAEQVLDRRGYGKIQQHEHRVHVVKEGERDHAEGVVDEMLRIEDAEPVEDEGA